MTIDLHTFSGYFTFAGVVAVSVTLGWLFGRGHIALERRYTRYLDRALAAAEGAARGYRNSQARIAAIMSGQRWLPEAPVSGSAPVPDCTVRPDPTLYDHTVRRPVGRVFETAYAHGLRQDARTWPAPPRIRPETLADLEHEPVPHEDERCVCGGCPDYAEEVDSGHDRGLLGRVRVAAAAAGRLAGRTVGAARGGGWWGRVGRVGQGLARLIHRRDAWVHDGWEDRLDELAELRAGRHRAPDEAGVAV